jgi:NCAIR mutase (PurE)-related protein
MWVYRSTVTNCHAFYSIRHRSNISQSANYPDRSTLTIKEIFSNIQNGTISLEQAETILTLRSIASDTQRKGNQQNDEQILSSFAELDHDRSMRTGFPEVVYGEGKTVRQIALILDDMAKRVNERTSILDQKDRNIASDSILATR